MKSKLILIFVLILSSACAGRQNCKLQARPASEVHFGFNKDRLSIDELKKIDSQITFLKEAANRMITIEGHTDGVGSNEYNLELGDRRAREVKHHMVMQGVLPQQILVVSFGEENPRDKSKHYLNRRAELKLSPTLVQKKLKFKK